MSDAIIISVVNGFFSVSAVVVGLLVKKNVNKVHNQINSRMDELLEARRAEGNLQGRAQQTEENKSK